MRIRLFLPIVAAVALAACGSTAASPSVVAPATPSPQAATPSPSPDESSPAAGAATVMVATSDLGQILVDGEGRTLYLFTPDEPTGISTCYEGCAPTWPALLAEGEITVGPGLDDSDFSTALRTDGGDQVKIGNWPLYYFASDAAPGDTNGQGQGGVWYVVSPTGEAIK
ncbi:MAG: hypothetical protein WEF51_05565 [Chloroflexota bacterium]